MKRSRVIPGDVLINLVGPPLGKVSVVPEHIIEANINQAIAVYRIKDKNIRTFFSYYLQSKMVHAWFNSRSKKTSGQQNLTLQVAQDLPVPVPPNVQLMAFIAQAKAFEDLRLKNAAALDITRKLRDKFINSLCQR